MSNKNELKQYTIREGGLITLECTEKIGDIIKYIPSHERPQRSNSLQ
jgi:hypothetical protein